MKSLVVSTARFAQTASLALCKIALIVLLGSMAVTVLLRYGLSSGFLWLQDLSLYAFGLLLIFSVPCALSAKRHVRVDVLQKRDTGKIEAIGFVMLVLPFAGLLSYQSLFQAIASISIFEGSGQIGGLPGFFIVKAALPLAAFLIALQGLSLILQGDEGVQVRNAAKGRDGEPTA